MVIKAFVEKLQLWVTTMENNNFAQFRCVNATVGDKQNIRVHVREHLSKLEEEFQRYFPEMDMTINDLSFIRDSFTADVGVVVRASASQSVDLGFIPLVESYQKTLKNGIYSFPAWRSAVMGGCGEQAGKFACCVFGQGT